MTDDCICPSLDGYPHVQWIGTYFGDCVQTPLEKLSFGLGMLSIVFYLSAFMPQFIHNFKRRSIHGLSFIMIVIWACGDSANLIGTYLTAQLPSQKFIAQLFILLDILILIQYFSYFGNDDSLVDEEMDNESLASDDTLNETTPLVGQSLNSMISKNLISSTVIVSCIGLACGLETLNDPIYCNSKPALSSFTILLGTFCGWISGLFYFSSRIPQIYENHRLKSVEGLSFALFFLTISGNLSYGASVLLRTPELDNHFYFQTLPYIIGSLGVLIFDLIIMLQFLLYRKGFNGDLDRIS